MSQDSENKRKFVRVIEKITALLKKFSKQHKTKIPETNVRDHGKHQKTANEPESKDFDQYFY